MFCRPLHLAAASGAAGYPVAPHLPQGMVVSSRRAPRHSEKRAMTAALPRPSAAINCPAHVAAASAAARQLLACGGRRRVGRREAVAAASLRPGAVPQLQPVTYVQARHCQLSPDVQLNRCRMCSFKTARARPGCTTNASMESPTCIHMMPLRKRRCRQWPPAAVWL